MVGEWLTTQTNNEGTFIELIRPVSGQSMLHNFLAQYPAGGTKQIVFCLPVSIFNRVTSSQQKQGNAVIIEVDHSIARMAFLDTYPTLVVATEIMGVTPEGRIAFDQMQKAR